ncbi:MAG: hypothetical protein ACJ8AD_03885 [Gemmatimonadaceae bacterium]|jgi:uncharacterized protein YcfJ
MSKTFKIIGSVVGSMLGGWLGARMGIMTGFFLSTVGMGVGIYAGSRIAAYYEV